MIVVVGALAVNDVGSDAAPDGLAGGIALAAATAGSQVEVIGKVGDDPAGDALLISLARSGVGHVAVMRDPSRGTPTRIATDDRFESAPEEDDPAPPLEPAAGGAADTVGPILEPADVDLALRYLTDYRVVVVVHPPSADILREAVGATRWAGAHLVAILAPDEAPPAGLPDDALVLTMATDEVDVGPLIGRYAAAVDAGETTAAAFDRVRIQIS